MNSSANSTAAVGNSFPHVSVAFKRLCWKELLQLAPLVLVLLALDVLLHLLSFSSNAADYQAIHILYLHLVPCLFASGAGALLVSIEKEQRTIGWLNSLPIAPSQILRAKLCVGLACLAIVWLACLLIALVADRSLPGDFVFPKDGGLSIPFTLFNSMFLLFLGIATAWRYQTPLVALVMIVPLAVLATVVTLTIQGLSPERRLPDSLMVIFYVLFSGIALWFGWRSGKAYLTAQPRRFVAQKLLKYFERSGSRGSLLTAKPQGLASTLLWQFSVQNRMVLIAICAMVLLPALVLVVHAFRGELAMIVLPAWLIVSWLGASVFQSDSVHQRVKFLAERGVAPRTIWWTRQIIPFGLIAVGSTITAFLVWYVSNDKRGYVVNSDFRAYPVLLLGTPVVLVVHAVAQWLGQLIRSPIVSLILAPAVTFSAAAYLTFAIVETGAPLWIVLFPIALCFIATRVMTQPWMDGRTGLKYWLGHCAFLLAALAVPAMPFLLTLCFYPGMPRSVERRLFTESLRNPTSNNQIELRLLVRPPLESEFEPMMGMAGVPGELEPTAEASTMAGVDSDGEISTTPEVDIRQESANQPAGVGGEASGGEAGAVGGEFRNLEPDLGLVEQIKQNVAYIESQLASRAGSVGWSQGVSFLSAEAMLTRSQLDLDPNNEASKERFQTAVRVLVEIDKRLRMSWRLLDQEFADRLEIWMYQQLKAEGGRALLGEPNSSAIAKILSDKAGRVAARRRAIVQSWNRSVANSQGVLQLGGMSMNTSSRLAGWRGAVANHRLVSRATWLLLEYLESKDPSEADKRFAELAASWGSTATRNWKGGLSPEATFPVPGQNWFGEWENYRPE